MKRVYLVLFAAGVIVIAWVVFQFMSINLHPTETVTIAQPSPTPLNEPYTYSLIRVSSTSAITLIPNFSEKIDTRSLVDANGCSAAINGGFYDTAGKPLGFFFTNNRILGKQIQSALLNGYFWADATGTALISTDLPSNISYRFALQTGPMLLFNGQTMPLAIQNDEPARRMVAAKTRDNTYVFLTVYDENSVYGGPLLSDLPSAVEEISNQEKLRIADAINLDGGSASAFYNGDIMLSELTPVGSMFCID